MMGPTLVIKVIDGLFYSSNNPSIQEYSTLNEMADRDIVKVHFHNPCDVFEDQELRKDQVCIIDKRTLRGSHGPSFLPLGWCRTLSTSVTLTSNILQLVERQFWRQQNSASRSRGLSHPKTQGDIFLVALCLVFLSSITQSFPARQIFWSPYTVSWLSVYSY